MNKVPLTLTIVGWALCGGFMISAAADYYHAAVSGHGVIPMGFFALMYCMMGLAIGLGLTSVGKALK